ncbi:class I SAM-dependent methyltransferase [Amycolatopsis sp. cmx-11-51]|uniref:class I SAM-dependent methyltransferase n=1 Tax=unclassified Amycolatopsis TaxID=2618356 RepID=UPI0039E52DA5
MATWAAPIAAKTIGAAQLYDAPGQDYGKALGRQPALESTLRHLLPLLPPRAKILDAGSGTGALVALTCANAGHDVTGYDVSEKMIELPRARVPAARFTKKDMRDLTFDEGIWDAVLAFFSMLQLPRVDQDAMIARFAHWLAPGGHFVLATIPQDDSGRLEEWTGHWVQTFSYPVSVLRQRIEDTGLEIAREDVVDFTPAGDQAQPEPQVLHRPETARVVNPSRSLAGREGVPIGLERRDLAQIQLSETEQRALYVVADIVPFRRPPYCRIKRRLVSFFCLSGTSFFDRGELMSYMSFLRNADVGAAPQARPSQPWLCWRRVAPQGRSRTPRRQPSPGTPR